MRTDDARRIARVRGFMLNMDVFSHDFVWGEHHQQSRVEPIEPPDYSVLDLILRSGLSDVERLALFPDKFDLGSPISLSPKECTHEVAGRIVSRAEGMAPVLEGIAKLTTHHIDIYRANDRVKLYRVAKLLNRFLCKRTHLFSLLETPAEHSRGSLELTNPYSIGHEGSLRWMVADLRSLLAAEIPPKRLGEIDEAFRSPRYVLDEFTMDLQCVLKTNVRSVDEAVRRYQIVISDWLTPMRPLERQLLPLDEQLYIHLLTLDFIHYVRVEQQLEKERFHHTMVVDLSQYLQGADLIACADLETPTRISFFRTLLYKAVGQEVTDKVFRSMLLNVPVLLGHYYLKPQDKIPAKHNASLILAALVFDWDTRNNTQTFHPYMHGKGSTSGSIKMALRKGASSMSEEYRRIFRNALDWIHYSLRGQCELFEAQRSLTLGLSERVARMMESHDTERMAVLLNNLKGYAAHSQHVIARAKEQQTS